MALGTAAICSPPSDRGTLFERPNLLPWPIDPAVIPSSLGLLPPYSSGQPPPWPNDQAVIQPPPWITATLFERPTSSLAERSGGGPYLLPRVAAAPLSSTGLWLWLSDNGFWVWLITNRNPVIRGLPLQIAAYSRGPPPPGPNDQAAALTSSQGSLPLLSTGSPPPGPEMTARCLPPPRHCAIPPTRPTPPWSRRSAALPPPPWSAAFPSPLTPRALASAKTPRDSRAWSKQAGRCGFQ
ncbi:MAG: hypothetical protein JWS10_2641 [Cypionkella sp.]|nr:hypothetical protein [Cypionkella sp.]